LKPGSPWVSEGREFESRFRQLKLCVKWTQLAQPRLERAAADGGGGGGGGVERSGDHGVAARVAFERHDFGNQD
jgi:hypothetical protein